MVCLYLKLCSQPCMNNVEFAFGFRYENSLIRSDIAGPWAKRMMAMLPDAFK